MREIKFRVWLKKWNRYLENDEVYVLPIIAKNKLYVGIDGEHETFMGDEIEQYTGLKDKNGVEIYEGDIISDGQKASIVKFGNIGYDGSFNGMTGFYLSGYENEYFADGTTFLELRYHFDIKEFEVVGNIHE